MRGVSLTFDGLKIQGFSRAGDETWFRIDPPGLALDVGKGSAPLIGSRWIFLSHGHLDHTVGIAWVLSQRKHQGLGPTTIFCPRSMAGDLTEYIAAASRLESEELSAEVVGLEPGESRELERGLRLEVFEATHTVPALGCHLIRRRQKLRRDLESMAPVEIAKLKRNGVEVVRHSEELWLSYCGDTSAELFAREPRLFETKILLVECTFIGPQQRRHGERFGHLHLQDLAALAGQFENQAIVLCHLSRRHRLLDLEQAVARELPELAERIHFITGDELGGGE